MHKAKTPKLLLSVLAVFSLIFGGVVGLSAPANAANLQGCISSNYNPNNCVQALSSSVALTVTDINVNTSTAVSTADLSPQVTCPTGTKSFMLYPKGSYVQGTNLTTVAGLSFSATTAQFTGTSQSTAFATTQYDILGQCSDTTQLYKATIAITVVSTSAPAISPLIQTVTGTNGTAITATASFSVVRFSGVPTFTVSPALPAGLSINSSTGVVSGTATVSITETVFRVTATYTTETAEANINITINDAAQGGGAGGGAAAPEPSRKVTICHRTHSVTNPYVRITVDYNSVNKKSGHQIHDEIFAGEHVFKAGIYKRAKDKDWGDIIPADPSGLSRWKPLNWTSLGADIYNGKVDGCPAFDAVKYYNALREAGVPEKKIKQEISDLETEQAEAEPTAKKSNVSEIKYTGSNKNIAEEDNDKVTLCHRTNSITNPYVRITVSASSVYKKAGHYGHDEIYDGHHVFDSSVAYPNNKKDWGDIIPADSTGKNRWAALNMTALGKQIYDGTVPGCAEKDLQTLYNQLREEGKSKKEILAELEKEKNADVDPKDIDELTYTGSDPKTEKSEPKGPVAPANVKIPNQSLSGIVWLDVNKDGLKDPDEPFIKGINIKVTNSTTGEVLNASLTTDENGFYLVEGIPAGSWKVTTEIPSDLIVTYDSYENPEGEIVEGVTPSSAGFTWVGLVGTDEKVTMAKLGSILRQNPNAIPLSQVPSTLLAFVKNVKAAKASGAKVPNFVEASAGSSKTLAYTGTNDLTLLFFGVLLMLSGLAVRLARTKQ